MRMTMALVVLLCGTGPALADDWQALDGPAIAAALTSRALGYPDGTLQDFRADGSTQYADSAGRWEVRGDRYCSLWPPSDRWTCYAVERRRIDIRFTAEDGTRTVGRYVDLQ